jgi:hypothetical protein
MSAKELLAAAEEALNREDWEGALRIAEDPRLPSPPPFPVLICRGLANCGLARYQVRQPWKLCLTTASDYKRLWES